MSAKVFKAFCLLACVGLASLSNGCTKAEPVVRDTSAKVNQQTVSYEHVPNKDARQFHTPRFLKSKDRPHPLPELSEAAAGEEVIFEGEVAGFSMMAMAQVTTYIKDRGRRVVSQESDLVLLKKMPGESGISTFRVPFRTGDNLGNNEVEIRVMEHYNAEGTAALPEPVFTTIAVGKMKVRKKPETK